MRCFKFVSLLLVACLYSVILKAQEANTFNQTSYKGMYELSLEDRKNYSIISGAKGKMYYQINKEVGGWVVRQDTILYVTSGEDIIFNRFNDSFYEGVDHDFLNFRYRHSVDGDVFQDVSGFARLDPPAHAYFILPEEKSMVLKEPTFFPVGFNQKMIQSNFDENSLQSFNYFDGGAPDKYYLVSVIKDETSLNFNLLDETRLNKYMLKRQWKLSADLIGKMPNQEIHHYIASFYDQAISDQHHPDIVVSVFTTGSGVLLLMIYDFGDFVLRYELKEFEFIS